MACTTDCENGVYILITFLLLKVVINKFSNNKVNKTKQIGVIPVRRYNGYATSFYDKHILL